MLQLYAAHCTTRYQFFISISFHSNNGQQTLPLSNSPKFVQLAYSYARKCVSCQSGHGMFRLRKALVCMY